MKYTREKPPLFKAGSQSSGLYTVPTAFSADTFYRAPVCASPRHRNNERQARLESRLEQRNPAGGCYRNPGTVQEGKGLKEANGSAMVYAMAPSEPGCLHLLGRSQV